MYYSRWPCMNGFSLYAPVSCDLDVQGHLHIEQVLVVSQLGWHLPLSTSQLVVQLLDGFLKWYTHVWSKTNRNGTPWVRLSLQVSEALYNSYQLSAEKAITDGSDDPAVLKRYCSCITRAYLKTSETRFKEPCYLYITPSVTPWWQFAFGVELTRISIPIMFKPLELHLCFSFNYLYSRMFQTGGLGGRTCGQVFRA